MLKDKTVLRNIIGVITGLIVVYLIVNLGITLNAERLGWTDEKVFPEWRHIIKYFTKGDGKQFEIDFFGLMLLSSGIAALCGGIVTAIIVRKAKQAYSMLIGFILLLVAFGDIIFTPYHPTWYEIAICPVLFLFSWIGGLIIDIIYKKFFRKKKPISQSY
ncbi:hypothetical protein [Faecalibacter rhinopitheci]|uniref:Uncharacterized protein n=1 Tax=Faecalibacter rhinopitheci TaxID=2779678 RepID=A0A8J7FNV0_9FLAO|nr:hypothetical protein [Faecalibacter rhinopitheci]MBF0596529.1 hypothetical protein [Faecalibacter rhinopitheci]MBQ0147301.1 hypothetical protein [Candidatus Onthonaster equi]